MEKIASSTTEFTRIKRDGIKDLQVLTRRYPLVTVISMVVLGFLGLLQAFTFTVSGVISSALMFALLYATYHAISEDSTAFYKRLKNSFATVIHEWTRIEVLPDEEFPANSN